MLKQFAHNLLLLSIFNWNFGDSFGSRDKLRKIIIAMGAISVVLPLLVSFCAV